MGTRGRYRDAARLGVIVALMHTFSVLVLALAWVGLTGVATLGTQTVTAWMQVVAGLIVIGVGTHLTYRHLRSRVRSTALTHTHAGGHGHGHGHTHTHTHAGPDLVDPWSRRGLVALALSGGLLPSPSAFIVLVSGLLTGRTLGAVVLVVAFSTGMAATLTAVGVASIKGAEIVTRRTRAWSSAARVASWTPAIAGAAVSALTA